MNIAKRIVKFALMVFLFLLFSFTGNAMASSLDLQNAINNVPEGTTATIALTQPVYSFNETVTINNKNIVLEAKGNVKFVKSATFKGTFININDNASLDVGKNLIFDGEGIASAAGNRKGVFIHVLGKLNINGTKFINSTMSSGSGIAPIYADGAKAKVIFNTGEFANNLYGTATGAYSANWYSAGAFILNNGAYMEMNGGTIHDNKVSYFKHNSFLDNLWANTSSAGAIIANSGSNFILNGGDIYNNFSSTGAIHVGDTDIYKFDRKQTDPSKLNVLDIAKFTFNGGSVRENKGAGFSGGITIFGNAEGVMNGGLIDKNKGYAGGAMLVMDYYVDGTQGVNQTRAKVSIDEWSKLYPAAFTMNNGIITNNLAFTCGGGIDVSSNKVLLQGGTIKGNKAGDQGGGVYVTAVPYVLKIKNAYIDVNEASNSKTWIHSNGVMEDNGNGGTSLYPLTLGSGGGVWFCPTGNAQFYAENGAIIINNTGEFAGDDFKNEDLVPLKYTISLPNRTPLGQKIYWYKDAKGDRYSSTNQVLVTDINGNTDPNSLKAQIEGNNPLAEKPLFSLFIANNIANKGGGIGSNGSVVIGEIPFDQHAYKDILVEKQWNGINPKPIEVEARIKLKNGYDYLVEKFELNQANSFVYTIKDLPANVDNTPIENLIYIKELNSSEYSVTINSIINIGSNGPNKLFKIVITNSKPGTPTPAPTPTLAPTPTPPITPVPPQNVPQTGDNSNIAVYIALIFLSLACVAVSINKKGKSNS